MIKKIINLLSVCCVFASINAVEFELVQDNPRKPKRSQEDMIAETKGVVLANVACLVMDVVMLDNSVALRKLQPGLSRMMSSATLLFHDVMEGPLVNARLATIIENGFCFLAIVAMPEIAIGTYAGAYAFEYYVGQHELSPPRTKAFCKYWWSRLGGICFQVAISAAINYFTVTED